MTIALPPRGHGTTRLILLRHGEPPGSGAYVGGTARMETAAEECGGESGGIMLRSLRGETPALVRAFLAGCCARESRAATSRRKPRLRSFAE